MKALKIKIAAIAALILAGLGSACWYVASHRPPLSGLGTATPSYSIQDIGVGMASSINNRGLIAGMHTAGTYPGGFPYFHGFLWQQGVMTDIGTFGGLYSNADTVSDGGQILGTAAVPGADAHGLPVEHLSLWQNGSLSDISAFHGYRLSGGAINALGQVYVTGHDAKSDLYHLFLRDNGVMRDLGPLGHTTVTVRAVNRQGQVVGDIGAMTSKTHRAFLWDRGRLRDLGVPQGFDTSEAVGINDRGQIIGDAASYGGKRPVVHPFLWQDGKFQDLGTLGGYIVRPDAINNAGQVVGSMEVLGGAGSHAFLWQRGHMQDLTALIPRRTNWLDVGDAVSINDLGQIVGTGAVVGDNHIHSYLLMPLRTKENRKT